MTYLLKFLFGWIFTIIILLFTLIIRLIFWDLTEINGNKVILELLGEEVVNAMFFGKPPKQNYL